MKRAMLLASIAALGSGCVVRDSQDPCQDSGTVTVYWNFIRHTDTKNLAYGCSKAGVERVTLWIGNEKVFDGSCSDSRGVEGITITGYPEASIYGATVLGYDTDGHQLFEVQNNTVYTEECNTLDVPALVGNLDIAPSFATNPPTTTIDACSSAGVDTIRYGLIDSAGVIVSSNDVPCHADSPSFTVADLDLGAYTLEPIAALDSSASPTTLVYQACNATVNHFQETGDTVAETLIQNQTCP